MTLREFKALIDALPESALDYDVWVDTDGYATGTDEVVYAVPQGATIMADGDGEEPCVVIVTEVWE